MIRILKRSLPSWHFKLSQFNDYQKASGAPHNEVLHIADSVFVLWCLDISWLQSVGIPKGTNSAHLLADLFYIVVWQSLCKSFYMRKKYLSVAFNYIDSVLSNKTSKYETDMKSSMVFFLFRLHCDM